MVDGQVRPSDVTDVRIIDAMLAVPREAFVPSQSARWPISTSISMSAKAASAERSPDQAGGHWRIVQAADIKEADNVLVVGCATGYAAADGRRLAPAGDGDRERFALGGEGELCLAGRPERQRRPAAAVEATGHRAV